MGFHYPQGELAQEVVRMHYQWLGYNCFKYTQEAHAILAMIYVSKVELSI